MRIIIENLYGYLNEDMQQARAILKKLKIPESDPRFQELKDMLVKDNKIGYIGKFAKWVFKDGEPWNKLIEVYDMLKSYPHKIPPIHTFKSLENLFDFLQGSEIDFKVKKIINQIPSRARKHVTPKLEKLIELNITYGDHLRDFYAKKGGKFKNSQDLYNETEALINNLSGGFNLDKIKEKIAKNNLKVEIALERPDLLVLQPKNYIASKALGARSWCISYSEPYWNSYVDVFSNQYFIFDFSKSLSDKKSMIGVTVNPDKSFKAAHFKDDSVCSNSYMKTIFEE